MNDTTFVSGVATPETAALTYFENKCLNASAVSLIIYRVVTPASCHIHTT